MKSELKVSKESKNGRSVQVFSQWVENVFWVHYNGQTHSIVPEKRKRRGQEQDGYGDQGNEVLSPMPGKILKVNIQVGAQVEKGQTLVVMEAMKMEYSLEAPGSGKVAAVHCDVDDQVTSGAVLIELETVEE